MPRPASRLRRATWPSRPTRRPTGTAATLRVLDHYLHTATDADRLLNPHRGVGQKPPAPAAGVTPEPTADSTAAMTWFGHESPALRAALDLAVSSGLDLQAWWLAWGMTTFYERRWDKHAWLGCQRTGMAAAERAGDRLLQAISQYNVGYVYAELGDLDRAGAHFAAALAGYRAVGNVRGQATVHLNLGITARRQGRYADALAGGEKARELYGTIDDHLGQARALNNIGWCYLTLGEHRRALDYCRRSVAVHEAAGNRMGAAHSWDSVGMAHFRLALAGEATSLGELDEALACYRRALASFRDQHDRQYEAIVLGHIGDAEQAADRPRPARDAWRRALGILTELDHPDADGIRAKLALASRSSTTFPYNSRESV